MTKETRNSAPPFSLRLTPEERRALELRASGQSLGAFIRSCLFDGPGSLAVARRVTGRKAPVQDHEALGQTLAMLGSSRLSSNLNQLARAANAGALPVSRDTEIEIHEACADIRFIRENLMRALGLRDVGGGK